MTAKETTSLTIFFADVCRSTELFEQLGDVAARRIIGDALAAMATIVEHQYGQVIKSIGDELMCTFDEPAMATQAAVAMQQEIPRELTDVTGGLQLRIGFHHGEVLREHGDVFGDAVNVAARLAGIAHAGQILSSSASVAMQSSQSARSLGAIVLKGRQQPVDVSELLWQGDEGGLTTVAGPISDEQIAAAQGLNLRFGGRELALTGQSFATTIGRDPHNDLIVDQPMVSRHHATIDVHTGYFSLVDRSTNGTFVLIDGDQQELRRSELRLFGGGEIYLGQTDAEPIHFSVS